MLLEMLVGWSEFSLVYWFSVGWLSSRIRACVLRFRQTSERAKRRRFYGIPCCYFHKRDSWSLFCDFSPSWRHFRIFRYELSNDYFLGLGRGDVYMVILEGVGMEVSRVEDLSNRWDWGWVC